MVGLAARADIWDGGFGRVYCIEPGRGTTRVVKKILGRAKMSNSNLVRNYSRAFIEGYCLPPCGYKWMGFYSPSRSEIGKKRKEEKERWILVRT
jgi:hypothetical protein